MKNGYYSYYKLVRPTNKHRLNGFVFVSLQCALKP